MSLDRQYQLIRRYTGSIIGHLDEAPPGVGQLNRDRFGPGVEAVLHQLLYYGRRPFYHFSGCDLRGHFRRQYPYGHGRIIFRL